MSTDKVDESCESTDTNQCESIMDFENNINSAMDKYKDKLKKEQEELIQEQGKLKKERAEFEKTRANVESELKRYTGGCVKVNVGGTRYETTLSTLQKYPDSMLGAMFSGRHELHVDDNGYSFIDRDGKYFGDVLNYLRDGEDVILSVRNVVDLKMINFELNYYGLPEIGKKSKNSNDSRVKLNVGGVKYETTLESLRCEMDGNSSWNDTLRAIFDPDQEVDLDEEGCVFIDRDGKHFNKILNLIRDIQWGQDIYDHNIRLYSERMDVEAKCASNVQYTVDPNHVEYDEIKAECEYYKVWG